MQTEFTEDELLATDDVVEPVFAGGVRCHGGFDADGNYVSPRTKHRVPAIEAWQERHRKDFGKDIIDIPLETWPENFPNLDQAKFLIRAGVREPLIATLTRIGTVEGFGANIRLLNPSDMQRFFDESVEGTAISHLGKGLFEAHGRDEAGFEEEAGHKDMWFAARDIAFESPRAKVDIDAMLARMGFGQPGSGGPSMFERVLPDDIDVNLEMIASLMFRVLLIEIQAFHTFRWSEAWLSDTDLVAGDGEAAKLVEYIRADETPHVGYLRTALTEMRDRTWIGISGKKYKGAEMIDTLWRKALDSSLGIQKDQSRAAVLSEVEYWAMKRENGKQIIEEFHSLGDPDEQVDRDAVAAAAKVAPISY